MGRTAVLLIAALVILPLAAFAFSEPLNPQQLALLRLVLWQCAGFVLLCFVVGELSGNLSQVDKLWSITPIVYAWTLTLAGEAQPRMLLMSVLVSLWGLRLTYNFSRHGAYRWRFWEGHEDYRWAHVRANPALQGRGRMLLFNLLFICGYQHALLLLIVLPILAVQPLETPLGPADAVLGLLFLGLLVMETVADQQQWRFQLEKHRRIAAGQDLGEEYARGFVASGLWARSRHPNYFAEQALWVVLFGFSLAAGAGLNWSIAGCVLLILLFRGSSNLSESISAGKYPAYVAYQAQVPRFWPKLGGSPPAL